MTATDKAFIRVFDSHADVAALAPHVSFATRGVPIPAAAISDVLHQGSSQPNDAASTEHDARPAASPVAAAAARSPMARPAPPRKQLAAATSAPTYLPSAFRQRTGPVEPGTCEPPRFGDARLPGTGAGYAGADREQPDRRPLAEPPGDPPEQRGFRPALEVDTFRWPAAVLQLLQRHRDLLEPLREAFEHARKRQERIIVFQSTGRGSGCTTYVLAAARMLAAMGCSVAVVEAEFARPHLASALGLAVGEGWEGAILGGGDLAETVIRSLSDNVSVAPLAVPVADEPLCHAILSEDVRSALRILAEHYDMVLVDAGCLDESAGSRNALEHLYTSTADACVLVHADHPQVTGEERQVKISLPMIGIVENFAVSD